MMINGLYYPDPPKRSRSAICFRYTAYALFAVGILLIGTAAFYVGAAIHDVGGLR